MRWVTRDHVHLDRVASPWLIRRFVDPAAEFVFAGWEPNAPRPADAIPFGIAGVELGPHDAAGTTFEKILAKYRIDDVALARIGRVIARGVEHTLHGYRPGPEDADGQIAVGLLALSEGLMLTAASDLDIIATSTPIYDALYANFTVQARMAAQGLTVPKATRPGPGEKFAFLRKVWGGK